MFCKGVAEKIRKGLKADSAAKHEYKADEIIRAYEAGNTKQFFRALRALRKFRPRPLQALRAATGAMIQTAGEQKERWYQHFAGILDGSVGTYKKI